MKAGKKKANLGTMLNLPKYTKLSMLIVACSSLFLTACGSTPQIPNSALDIGEEKQMNLQKKSISIKDPLGDVSEAAIDLSKGVIKVSKRGNLSVAWHTKQKGVNESVQYQLHVKPKNEKEYVVYVDKLGRNANVIFYYLKGKSKNRKYLLGHYNAKEISIKLKADKMPFDKPAKIWLSAKNKKGQIDKTKAQTVVLVQHEKIS